MVNIWILICVLLVLLSHHPFYLLPCPNSGKPTRYSLVTLSCVVHSPVRCITRHSYRNLSITNLCRVTLVLLENASHDEHCKLTVPLLLAPCGYGNSHILGPLHVLPAAVTRRQASADPSCSPALPIPDTQSTPVLRQLYVVE